MEKTPLAVKMLSLRFGICQRKLIRTLSGHSGAVTSVVFSPDGRTLISGSKDKTIKVWQQ